MEQSAPLRDIRSLTHEELRSLVAELGQPAFRAKQLIEWLGEKQATSFDEMTNLPKALRASLAERFSFNIPVEVAKQVSRDGSRKYLLQFTDGVAVETVGMPSRGKLSVCVSSQAGCGMRCSFCATGLAGLTRSLTAQEIVDQVIHVGRDFGERVTSVVFMGQGEPFANYNEVVKALRMLNSPEGLISVPGTLPSLPAASSPRFAILLSFPSSLRSLSRFIPPYRRLATSLCLASRSSRCSVSMRRCRTMSRRPVAAPRTNTP